MVCYMGGFRQLLHMKLWGLEHFEELNVEEEQAMQKLEELEI